jgi:hypothetical protein
VRRGRHRRQELRAGLRTVGECVGDAGRDEHACARPARIVSSPTRNSKTGLRGQRGPHRRPGPGPRRRHASGFAVASAMSKPRCDVLAESPVRVSRCARRGLGESSSGSSGGVGGRHGPAPDFGLSAARRSRRASPDGRPPSFHDSDRRRGFLHAACGVGGRICKQRSDDDAIDSGAFLG